MLLSGNMMLETNVGPAPGMHLEDALDIDLQRATRIITAYQLPSALMHDISSLVTYLPCIIPLAKSQ